MAIPFTDNNGSTFYNINDCRTFAQTISTNIVGLSAYPCSELIFVNRTGQTVFVYDNGYLSPDNAFILANNESFVFRGLTNSSTVSAQTLSGGGIINYRTQYFSSLPQR
jgi:hypothetical protein